MSKGIFLYSEDKKYKCAFELAETTDHFGCPDHSVMVLFEERENGTYVIAEARDKLLETEKDKKIADLKTKLAESKQEANDWKQRFESSEERFKTFNSNGVTALNLKNDKIEQLKQQLAEKEEIIEKT